MLLRDVEGTCGLQSLSLPCRIRCLEEYQHVESVKCLPSGRGLDFTSFPSSKATIQGRPAGKVMRLYNSLYKSEK